MALNPEQDNAMLFEVAWEVCQQLGGIYTVMRTKSPRMTKVWGDRYCLVGPYDAHKSTAEFRELPPEGLAGHAVEKLKERGIDAHFGQWLCTGRPWVILLNPRGDIPGLAEYKYHYWNDYHIEITDEDLLHQVMAFSCLCVHLFEVLSELKGEMGLLAHFHEWMAGACIPDIKTRQFPVKTVFTTHATMLGRYLAQNDSGFYEHLPFYNWHNEASQFNIHPQVRIERIATKNCDTFTTVSDITATECKHLLDREPDVILPNGLSIERFLALHEFQNLHRLYKSKIHEFVMGHFFPSYTFDLDKTLYFFSSGRCEYSNKGYDVTLEALARLNWRMKEAKSDRTVVFFMITRQPVRSIIADVLSRRAMMEAMHKTVDEITSQLGERLYNSVAQGVYPDLKHLVDDYWKLRLRQFIHEWKVQHWPSIVTHDLIDNHKDPILHKLRECNLLNQPDNPVKVVYHPEFISANSPLFDMDYDQFVRGCHLGIFPSAYEPWGYTPLECIARGVPAVTSDLAGFGSYLDQHTSEEQRQGLHICQRRGKDFHQATDDLTNYLFNFTQMERRERIDLRNHVEANSVHFDWHNLGSYYDEAHERAYRS
jgi:glycogen(starch) synthase